MKPEEIQSQGANRGRATATNLRLLTAEKEVQD
jgi:hypothetical protein